MFWFTKQLNDKNILNDKTGVFCLNNRPLKAIGKWFSCSCTSNVPAPGEPIGKLLITPAVSGPWLSVCMYNTRKHLFHNHWAVFSEWLVFFNLFFSPKKTLAILTLPLFQSFFVFFFLNEFNTESKLFLFICHNYML